MFLDSENGIGREEKKHWFQKQKKNMYSISHDLIKRTFKSRRVEQLEEDHNNLDIFPLGH